MNSAETRLRSADVVDLLFIKRQQTDYVIFRVFTELALLPRTVSCAPKSKKRSREVKRKGEQKSAS